MKIAVVQEPPVYLDKAGSIERAVALCEGPEITAADLNVAEGDGEASHGAAAGSPAWVDGAVARRLTLRELDDLYTNEILKLTGGNKLQAAKILGINRRTLYRRNERGTREQEEA